MTKFEQFKKAFDEKYSDESVYDFISDFESDNSLPFGGKLEQDLDEIKYDSYGDENSTLEKIFETTPQMNRLFCIFYKSIKTKFIKERFGGKEFIAQDGIKVFYSYRSLSYLF